VNRTLRLPLALPLCVLSTFALGAGQAAAAEIPGTPPPAEAPISAIAVEEIVAGQKGYGLSVFQGTSPERFDVEVVGVMNNTRPGTSYILAKLSGHGLEESGVVQGMSGSPVFVDGRLAGAVAFSWAFANGAMAGITPIGAMRRLSGVVHPQQAQPAARLDDILQVLAGTAPEGFLQRQLAVLRPQTAAAEAASGVQWSATGFGAFSQGILAQAVGSVAPAGLSTTSAELVPGGAVAAVLVDGDFRLAASGTVTDRHGDEILAFGHPFLGLGPIEVPMASGEVLGVLSSRATSFKLSNVGPVIGAFEEDRLAGIRGRIGARARTIPMTVRIGGATDEVFHMQVADVPELAPALLGVSTLASLDSASYAAGVQELDMEVRFDLGGEHGDVELRQVFDGPSAAPEAVSFLIALGHYLVQNALAPVELQEVEVTLRQSPSVQGASVVGGHAERTRVRPGETVDVRVDLLPFRGEPYRHAFTVQLPPDLPPGRYSLLVGDGRSIDAARFEIQPTAPVSFPQALELLRSLHSRRELVALGVFAESGLSVSGEVLPRLPGSMQSLWRAAGSRSATALPLAIAQQHVERLAIPVEGAVRIDLEVERPQPIAGEEAPADGEADESR
jgi:hypothetical protein